MRLTFCGGARSVTGANYLLETKNHKILIDCGLSQGSPTSNQLNFRDFSYDPKTIESVILTHAHLDHCGRLPWLYKNGFRGRVFCTAPTRDFTELVLLDSERIWRKQEPHLLKLFNLADVNGVLGLFEIYDYHRQISLGSDLFFQFKNAGRILGSAIVEIVLEKQKLVFSGDLGNPPTPLLPDPETVEQADYVIVESAYGDKVHQSKQMCQGEFENIIEDVVAQNGVLMVPVFTIERAQELLYELNALVEQKRIPHVPIFLDSPLAIEATQVYRKYRQYFSQQAAQLATSGDDIFNFLGLELTLTKEESKEINQIPSPKIILAGSGMSEGGRICYHELHYLSNSQNVLLIIAYQAQGTLGRKLADGHKKVVIFGQAVRVNAKIKSLDGYSSHADQPGLIRWLTAIAKPIKKVFIVQGEIEAAEALGQQIKDHLGIPALAPKIDQVFEL